MRLAALFLESNSTGHAGRERHRHLESDIGCFATDSDRQDLFAALGRYPDNMTTEIREMLDREQVRERCDRLLRYGHLRVI